MEQFICFHLSYVFFSLILHYYLPTVVKEEIQKASPFFSTSQVKGVIARFAQKEGRWQPASQEDSVSCWNELCPHLELGPCQKLGVHSTGPKSTLKRLPVPSAHHNHLRGTA